MSKRTNNPTSTSSHKSSMTVRPSESNSASKERVVIPEGERFYTLATSTSRERGLPPVKVVAVGGVLHARGGLGRDVAELSAEHVDALKEALAEYMEVLIGATRLEADLALMLVTDMAEAREAGTPYLTESDDPRGLLERVKSAMPKHDRLDEETGPFYDTASLTKWLGVTKQALDNRVKKHTLLMCRTSDGKRVYPAWQFDNHGDVHPGIQEVIRAFSEIGLDDGWTIARWLNLPNPDLGDQAASELLAGGVTEPVVRAARRDADRLSH